MKILYLHRVASKDGQYVHIEEMIRALTELGHQVKVIGPAMANVRPFGRGGGAVAWIRGHLPRAFGEVMELGYSLVTLIKLLWAAIRFRPDVIYERYNLFSPAGVLVKRWLRLPLLLEVNAPLFEERSQFGGLALLRLARWSERYCWCHADRVLPVTAVLAKRIREQGVPAGRIQVIHNGIDPDRFPVGPRTPAAEVTIGFVGFCREWHGLEQVIRLLAEPASTTLRFLLVGDGPALPLLIEEAKRLGVADRMAVTGLVPRDQVAACLERIDIALQPAVVPYACPLKLLEYMVMGKAIVAPACANVQELLEPEVTAVLFEPGSVAGLADAIRRLRDDIGLRERLGSNARSEVLRRPLTWSSNAQRVTRLATELLAPAKPPAQVRQNNKEIL